MAGLRLAASNAAIDHVCHGNSLVKMILQLVTINLEQFSNSSSDISPSRVRIEFYYIIYIVRFFD
jgi:hypothetical protein